MTDGPLTYADLAGFPLTAISALHASFAPDRDLFLKT